MFHTASAKTAAPAQQQAEDPANAQKIKAANDTAGDAILSFYQSPTGRYRGFECLQQRDEKRYTVRGTMLDEDKVISSWAFDLSAVLV